MNLEDEHDANHAIELFISELFGQRPASNLINLQSTRFLFFFFFFGTTSKAYDFVWLALRYLRIIKKRSMLWWADAISQTCLYEKRFDIVYYLMFDTSLDFIDHPSLIAELWGKELVKSYFSRSASFPKTLEHYIIFDSFPISSSYLGTTNLISMLHY